MKNKKRGQTIGHSHRLHENATQTGVNLFRIVFLFLGLTYGPHSEQELAYIINDLVTCEEC